MSCNSLFSFCALASSITSTTASLSSSFLYHLLLCLFLSLFDFILCFLAFSASLSVSLGAFFSAFLFCSAAFCCFFNSLSAIILCNLLTPLLVSTKHSLLLSTQALPVFGATNVVTLSRRDCWVDPVNDEYDILDRGVVGRLHVEGELSVVFRNIGGSTTAGDWIWALLAD